MNSLNLRVSTARSSAAGSGENVKKNSEIRASLLELPAKYIKSTANYVEQYRQVQTVLQQVLYVKRLFNEASAPNANAELMLFLSDLVFYSTLNHPVRNQIVKLYCNATAAATAGGILGAGILTTDIGLTIVTSLERSLEERFQHIATVTDDDNNAWNELIVSVSGCFSNFPVGLKALSRHKEEFLNILYETMQHSLAAITLQQSPTRINERYLTLHNALRSLLSYLQEFSDIDASLDTKLETISDVCIKLSINEDVPMETRLNSALVYAQLEKRFNRFDGFMQKVRQMCEAQDLPICISMLNSFSVICYLQNSEVFLTTSTNVVKLGHAYATLPNVLVYAARALFQYARNLLQVPVVVATNATEAAASEEQLQQLALVHTKLALRNILLFALAHLQHHIDTVRHLARDMLKQVVLGAQRFKFEKLYDKIYEACNGEDMSLQCKCMLLLQCVQVFGASTILKNCPRLFENVFDENLGRDRIVDSVFECLMNDSYNSATYECWTKTWLSYLLEIAALQDERLPTIELLLIKSVKLDNRIVHDILGMPNLLSSTKLSSLWAVRKSGARFDNFNVLLERFSDEIRIAMLAANEEISLMALRVIVETHKTTEPLTQFECQSLSTYIDYHANCPDAAVRHKAYTLLGKALARCDMTLAKIYKAHKSISDPLPDSVPLVFLRDVMHAMVANLFPSANYSRRWIALQLLQQCLDICRKHKFSYANLMPTYGVKYLLGVLGDSYEGNKVFAVTLLKQLEEQIPDGLVKTLELPLNIASIQELLISLRPPDSITGAYQLDFYCNHATPETFGMVQHKVQYNATIFAALNWCLSELQLGLKMAQKQLQRAAKLNPLYGLLYAIRHLLKQLDLKLIAKEAPWREYIAKMVTYCKQVSAAVAPVVNSSSPEGHLPNDFSTLPTEYNVSSSAGISDVETSEEHNGKILAKRITREALERLKTTPQMILLCAWRTVKEVSLILGELVLHAPIEKSNDDNYLLTHAQIHGIGMHFREMLAETKHRGAFEQAYVGFSMYCSRLWCSDAMELNELPMQWLHELLALIANSNAGNKDSAAEKLCATRRSAGLPFMIQALVTSELHVGTTKALHCSMQRLLLICKEERGISAHAESRTHALNILRALFRCSDLGDGVSQYVAKGVMCALHSYDATNWPERNSATLLFAALMTRIFGVQRTRDSDNLTIRNRMTGRIFFTRYPALFDYFYAELKKATFMVQKGMQAPKLHPMLLLLSRLYPSSLEGAESNLNIADFIPLISACSGVPEMHTRCLTAKALVALVDKDKLQEILLQKCARLLYIVGDKKTRNLNLLHGELLHIQYLLKQCHNVLANDSIISDVITTMVFFSQQCHQSNFVVMNGVLYIMNIMLEKYAELPNCDITMVCNLLHFNSKHYHEETERCAKYYTLVRRNYHLYVLHAKRLTLPAVAVVDYMLHATFENKKQHIEIVESTIAIVLLLLCGYNGKPDAASVDILDEFEFEELELNFVAIMKAEYRQELAALLLKSTALHKSLLALVARRKSSYPEVLMKCYATLSMLQPFVFDLKQLINEAAQFTADIKSPITMCIMRALNENECILSGSDDSNDVGTIWQAILAYALDIVDPWQPDFLRFKALQMLQIIAPHFYRLLHTRRLPVIASFVQLVLQLLMDDEQQTRQYAAIIVVNNLSENVELRKFVHWSKSTRSSGGGVLISSSCSSSSSDISSLGTDNIVPTLAQQLFLQSIADVLHEMTANIADDKLLLDIFRVIVVPHLPAAITVPELLTEDINKLKSNGTQCCSEKQQKSSGSSAAAPAPISDDTDLLYSEIFNKNEANVYSEPLKVFLDMLVVYRHTFTKRHEVLTKLEEYERCIQSQL